MFNPVIIAAIIVQALVARASRKVAAILGYLITTGILVWGISVYADGGQIALFGIAVSEPVFLLACLVWYGFDTNEFIKAGKPLAQVRQTVQPGLAAAAAQGDANDPDAIPLTVNWKGSRTAYDYPLQVWIDGNLAGSGSFVHGFNLALQTTAGPHTLSLNKNGAAPAVAFQAVKDRSYQVELEFSKFAAKFKLALSESGREPGDLAPQARQLYMQAEADYKKGVKLAKVLTGCDQAIQMAPQWAAPHNLRGAVLDDLGRKTEALQAYRQAVRLDPSFEDARASLAELEKDLQAG
jgi:tetratricopeptide (TPR) repeat protein